MKNLAEMTNNIEAYLMTNKSYIRRRLAQRFKNSHKISLKMQRFFSGFIDGLSTLYTKPFVRTTNLPKEIQAPLNEAMIYAEKYHNISRESLFYIKAETEFKAMDPSEYVLWPSEADYTIVFAKSENLVYKYEVGQSDKVKDTSLKLCQSYNSKTAEGWNDVEGSVIRKVLPFFVIRHPRLAEPQFNDLVELEADRIIDISWGMHNVAPKLLTQPVVTSAEDPDNVRAKLDSFGSTSEVMTLGMNDKAETINMGSLQNMKDLVEVWSIYLQQEALIYGVNRNRIIANSEIVSGEKLKVEMEYVNEARSSRAPIFVKAEKDFCSLYNRLYETKYETTSIIFLDLKFGSEKENVQQSEDNSQNE